MVRRRLNLAQVVCAVYTLSKPFGASRSEIIKFCKLRFRSVRNPRAFDKVLDLAVDEGLLTCFKRRYRLARVNCSILWIEGNRKERRERKVQTGRKKRTEKRMPKRKLVRVQKYYRSQRRPVQKRGLKEQSNLYSLWCKKHTQKAKKVNWLVKVSKDRKDRPKSHCKSLSSRISLVKNNQQSKTRCQNLTHLNSTRKHHTRPHHGCSKLRIQRKDEGKGSCKGGSNSSSNFHREVLRRTKQAATHAKSWDSLNYQLQRRQRENELLVKKSQLVQKILTRSHAASWDDLNEKLRRIKEAENRAEIIGDQNIRTLRSHKNRQS